MVASEPPPDFDPAAFTRAIRYWPTTQILIALADITRGDWEDDGHDWERSLTLHDELWRRRDHPRP